MYQPWLDEGFARPGARRTRADFEIAATCHLQVTASEEERRAVIDGLKPSIALYMGGMGAKEQNFHKNVFDRMGYDTISDQVQELFLAGKREQAVALIPDELAEDMHIVGDAGYVKERVAAWAETGVTTLLLSLRSPDEVRLVAETVA
jgi:alkanesulfonate monooxygenase SsuD/methylene tetrahydromethanopterin reductase-like flavin-dependent oxidoreductase (luciferase family)